MMAVAGARSVSLLADAMRARHASDDALGQGLARQAGGVDAGGVGVDAGSCLGAWRAEALVPPTSAWSGSSSSAGAMWYGGLGLGRGERRGDGAVQRAVSSGAAVGGAVERRRGVGGSGGGGLGRSGRGWNRRRKPSGRRAGRRREPGRGGLFGARAKRFKADPLMSWFIGGRWHDAAIPMPQGIVEQHASTPARRVWTSSPDHEGTSCQALLGRRRPLSAGVTLQSSECVAFDRK